MEDIQSELNADLAEIRAELTSEETEVTTETDVVEETPEVMEEAEESIETDVVEDEEGVDKPTEDETKPEDDKPWKSKNKVPAKKRISQLTAQKRELERQNKAFQARLDNLEKLVTGDNKEKTREDFVDDEAYQQHVIDTKVQERLEAQQVQQATTAQHTQKVEQLSELYSKNVEQAKNDIEDLEEVLPAFNTDIQMSENVKEHLLGSPAGVYTMYRIANDPELNERLGNATTAQADQVIAQIHDEIFSSINPTSQQATTNAVSNAPAVPKPPRSVKAGKGNDLMSLDGDDFLDAYNKTHYS